MAAFLNLYKSVLVPVLSEWLNIEEFVAIDTAFLNNVYRALWIDLIAQGRVIFERAHFRLPMAPLSIGMFEWMERHGLNVHCIHHCELLSSNVKEWKACKPEKFSSLMLKLSESVASIYVSRIGPRTGDATLQEYCPVAAATVEEYCSVIAGLTRLQRFSAYRCMEGVNELLTSINSHIKELRIESCMGVTDHEIQRFVARQPSLVDVAIIHCNVSQKALTTIKQPLVALNLYTSSNFHYSAERLLMHCVAGLVTFNCCECTDEVLSELSSNCATTLSTLGVSNSRELRRSTVLATIRTCRAVTDLDLSFCSGVDDDVITELAALLPGLQRVSLKVFHSYGEGAFAALVGGCRALRELTWKGPGIEEAMDVTLRHLVTADCTALEVLKLNALRLTTSAMESLLSGCPNLTELSVEDFTLDGAEGNALAGLTAVGRRLTTLSLVVSPSKISASTLVTLLSHCPAVTDLTIQLCDELRDKALEAMLRKCSPLTKLDLRANHELSLTSEIVDVLHARHARTMRSLRINDVYVPYDLYLTKILLCMLRLRELGVDEDLFNEMVVANTNARLNEGIVHPNLHVIFDH